MVIELYTEKLVNGMRAISHREVEGIADADARYRVEAGTEKLPELYSCLEDARKRLAGRCSRFLKASYIHKIDNISDVPTSYEFEFVMSERRSIGKTEPLLEAMHTFMQEYALSKFYSHVSQGDLSNKHSLQAIEAGNLVDQLLFTKQPPRV